MKRQKLSAVLVAGLLLSGVAAGQQTQGAPALTPRTLRDALTAMPQGPDAERLAERIRRDFGGRDALLRGAAPPQIDELSVAFAIEVTEVPANAPAPRVMADVGMFTMPLTKVGTGGVYAGVARLTHGAAFTWHYEAGGRRFGGSQLDVYETHPDGKERPGVPKGVTRQMPPWESKIFPGTQRDWWVYVPAQYKQDTPAAVMIFQDGAAVRDYVPIVFDNLIATGDMPVTVAIFIEPGGVKASRDNRSFEYDTLSDQYARFLLEEILPEVERSVRLRHDAASRAISGASSGAMGRWTLANMTLARSLAFTGYDYRFEQGQGFHNNRHGRAILPDTLRWLWRDYKSQPTGTASR